MELGQGGYANRYQAMRRPENGKSVWAGNKEPLVSCSAPQPVICCNKVVRLQLEERYSHAVAIFMDCCRNMGLT